jgi:hypothetical protein
MTIVCFCCVRRNDHFCVMCFSSLFRGDLFFHDVALAMLRFWLYKTIEKGQKASVLFDIDLSTKASSQVRRPTARCNSPNYHYDCGVTTRCYSWTIFAGGHIPDW